MTRLFGNAGAQRGFTMLDLLLTMVILAFGLLGLASLQGTMHLAQVEAYQRAQAVLLLQDMSNRLMANYANAGNYATANPLGTGDDWEAGDCAGAATQPERDACEWSLLLKGASETKSAVNVGAMVDARGCVEVLTVRNAALGACTAGEYRVTVVWQGLTATVEPTLACGDGLYGDDANRRAISQVIQLGVPRCT